MSISSLARQVGSGQRLLLHPVNAARSARVFAPRKELICQGYTNAFGQRCTCRRRGFGHDMLTCRLASISRRYFSVEETIQLVIMLCSSCKLPVNGPDLLNDILLRQREHNASEVSKAMCLEVCVIAIDRLCCFQFMQPAATATVNEKKSFHRQLSAAKMPGQLARTGIAELTCSDRSVSGATSNGSRRLSCVAWSMLSGAMACDGAAGSCRKDHLSLWPPALIVQQTIMTCWAHELQILPWKYRSN